MRDELEKARGLSLLINQHGGSAHLTTPKAVPNKPADVSKDSFESLTKIGRERAGPSALLTPSNVATYSTKKKTPAQSSREFQRKRK